MTPDERARQVVNQFLQERTVDLKLADRDFLKTFIALAIEDALEEASAHQQDDATTKLLDSVVDLIEDDDKCPVCGPEHGCRVDPPLGTCEGCDEE